MTAQFPSEVANRIYELLIDNQVALVTADGAILYGDQKRIAVTPTVCVEAGTTQRELAGVATSAGRTLNNHEVTILIYYAVVDTNQNSKIASEVCSETITRYLDDNPTLARAGDGGIVIHGYVTSIEPGYRKKGTTLFQAVRLTWNGKTKTILGA